MSMKPYSEQWPEEKIAELLKRRERNADTGSAEVDCWQWIAEISLAQYAKMALHELGCVNTFEEASNAIGEGAFVRYHNDREKLSAPIGWDKHDEIVQHYREKEIKIKASANPTLKELFRQRMVDFATIKNEQLERQDKHYRKQELIETRGFLRGLIASHQSLIGGTTEAAEKNLQKLAGFGDDCYSVLIMD